MPTEKDVTVRARAASVYFTEAANARVAFAGFDTAERQLRGALKAYAQLQSVRPIVLARCAKAIKLARRAKRRCMVAHARKLKPRAIAYAFAQGASISTARVVVVKHHGAMVPALRCKLTDGTAFTLTHKGLVA
jgi:hypothetical protein